MSLAIDAARVILYADDRTEPGREALKLLEGTHLLVRIPMSGGLPFAIRGRSRYVGVEEIRTLAAELHGRR